MGDEKISIVTDEIAQDLNTVTKFLVEEDIRAIEIRMMGGSRVPDIDREIWTELKKRTVAEGWKVNALSPGTFKGDSRDRSRLEMELKSVLPDTIENAKSIGAEIIITFGFIAGPDEQPPSFIPETLYNAAEMCREAGISLLLENEPGSFADTPERTAEFVNMVGHPNLMINWDACNAGIFNDVERLNDGARKLGDLIQNVHVKDGYPVPGSMFPKYCPMTDGRIGWYEHLQCLKKLGYSDYLCIETHFEPLWEGSKALLTELRSMTSRIDFWEGD